MILLFEYQVQVDSVADMVTGVEDHHMMAVPWETSIISELDLTSTELSTECLENILLRMPGFTYLALGYCEFFSDRVCP